jgi:hypothetical protein
MRRTVEKTLFVCVILGLLFAFVFGVTGRDLAKWISGAFAIACFIQMGWILGDNNRQYEREHRRE